MIRPATSRTWPTEPGAPVRSAACIVCTESITQTSRALGAQRREDRVEVGLGEHGHVERAAAAGQPLGAQADLRGRLLAGDVERAPAGQREVAQRHVRERRLADARRAAEQDERAGHEAAAEHAVELADAGRKPRHALGADVAQGAPARPGAAPARRGRERPRCGGAARSSTSVFHASQPGHCPCQRAPRARTCEQTWIVVGRAIRSA